MWGLLSIQVYFQMLRVPTGELIEKVYCRSLFNVNDNSDEPQSQASNWHSTTAIKQMYTSLIS